MSDIKKMTNNENVIFYNNDLEQLLAQSAEECESLGILHLASYEKYNKMSNIINIPVIVLSSGIGFITGIDLNYDKMEIANGSEAMNAYLNFIQGKLNDEEKLMADLSNYCKLDTFAMTELLKSLLNISK